VGRRAGGPSVLRRAGAVAGRPAAGWEVVWLLALAVTRGGQRRAGLRPAVVRALRRTPCRVALGVLACPALRGPSRPGGGLPAAHLRSFPVVVPQELMRMRVSRNRPGHGHYRQTTTIGSIPLRCRTDRAITRTFPAASGGRRRAAPASG